MSFLGEVVGSIGLLGKMATEVPEYENFKGENIGEVIAGINNSDERNELNVAMRHVDENAHKLTEKQSESIFLGSTDRIVTAGKGILGWIEEFFKKRKINKKLRTKIEEMPDIPNRKIPDGVEKSGNVKYVEENPIINEANKVKNPIISEPNKVERPELGRVREE